MKKLNTKGFTIVEGLLVLVVAGLIIGTGWWVANRHNNSSNGTNNPALSRKVTNFYYANETGEIFYYNPNVDERIAVTSQLPLTNHRFLTTSDSTANSPIQIMDNSAVFYSSAKPKVDKEYGGEGEPERQSTIISLYALRSEYPLVKINSSDGSTLVDWVASNDGKSLYYLLQGPNKGSIDLHYADIEHVQDIKDTVVKTNIADPGQINNPLFVRYDGTLMLFTGSSDKIIQHTVRKGAYSTKEFSADCTCGLTHPRAVSPDGKKLMLEEQTSGESPANFVYYVLDLGTGKTTKVGTPPTNVAWSPNIWSPDSRSTLHNTHSFDQAKNFAPEVTLLNTSNKKDNIIAGKGSENTGEQALSWSPDDRFIAYADKEDIHFYVVKTGKLLNTSLKLEEVPNLSLIGWY